MAWTNDVIAAVWLKGTPVKINGVIHQEWRYDACGAWIGWKFYGNRDSRYGWEVDHINPNGGDGLANLQPLQWENNASKGDGPLACVVTASGQENVAVRQTR